MLCSRHSGNGEILKSHALPLGQILLSPHDPLLAQHVQSLRFLSDPNREVTQEEKGSHNGEKAEEMKRRLRSVLFQIVLSNAPSLIFPSGFAIIVTFICLPHLPRWSPSHGSVLCTAVTMTFLKLASYHGPSLHPKSSSVFCGFSHL